MTDDPQSDVLAFLADPATHGLGPGGVTHLRTHISDVFLAGERVYKTKRAVRYAFVDFTTPGARRAACEAEVALNRRTAPELYLGVAAIRRGPGGRLVLDGPGDAGPGETGPAAPGNGAPVEWAVVMRRFDENRTLDRLAARGELDGALIDRLVDEVVALHAGAEVRRGPYGGARALATVIAQNADDMAGRGDVLAPDRVRALMDATRAAHMRRSSLLDARKDAGFVRRCHGDLHLGNAVLWRGTPLLFDCIEFSEDIGTVDVAYDFAFLLMDLEVRGLRALANRAFSRYFGRLGGTEVLAALPLMLSLRAQVRAKVTAMAAAGEGDPAARQAAENRANVFLAAAERFLDVPSSPRLIAVGGLSGTGKTTLAAALAPRFGTAPGALHVRSDVIRKRLAGVAPEDRLPPDSYTPEASRAVYQAMLDDARPALAGGYSVVLDAVFANPGERREAEELAREAGVAFTGLWLEAPVGTLKGRVGTRQNDASDATEAVVERQTQFDTGNVDWSRLDAGVDPATILARARALLEHAP